MTTDWDTGLERGRKERAGEGGGVGLGWGAGDDERPSVWSGTRRAPGVFRYTGDSPGGSGERRGGKVANEKAR